MRRAWTAAALLALGVGCAGGRARIAQGDGGKRPLAVETGVFRKLGLLTPQWVLDPANPAAEDVALRVTSRTKVYEEGAYVGLDEVDAGEQVRVFYSPQREGPGIVERIEVLPRPGKPRQQAQPAEQLDL